MYYLQSRYYDPELCRFISADDFAYINTDTPMSVNAYAYCINNPLKYSDSTGQDVKFDFVFKLLRKLFIIDFVFPEFRYVPKKTSATTKKISNWVSEAGELIGVAITELFTCLDLQEIAKILKIEFSFTDWADYLQEKVNVYKAYFDSLIDKPKNELNEIYDNIFQFFSSMIKFPKTISDLITVSSSIDNFNNNFYNRYISPVGNAIMLLFDGFINGIIDLANNIISGVASPVVGAFASILLDDFVSYLGTRDKAEFYAYNWYYFLFVNWR